MTDPMPKFNPEDFHVSTYRTNAHGQWVNQPDNAVRVLHLPTGIYVDCSRHRSMHENKAPAIEEMMERLVAFMRQDRPPVTKEDTLRGPVKKNDQVSTVAHAMNEAHDVVGRLADPTLMGTHSTMVTGYILGKIMSDAGAVWYAALQQHTGLDDEFIATAVVGG